MKASNKSRPQMTLYALHGFLGLPSDWSFLSPKALSVDAIVNCDLLKHEGAGLKEWARQFNNSLPKDERRIVMGYSLGGRLAMHTLIDDPTLWDAAIIISAHPGLETLSEKSIRIENDYIWAQRFENEPWDVLMQAWNSIDVFSGGTVNFERHECDYSRIVLADAMRNWSLGRQENLRYSLQQLGVPIQWIAGSNDLSYRTQAISMTLLHPKSQVWIAPEAGHRVPWDCPIIFQQQVQQFIRNLEEIQHGNSYQNLERNTQV